MESGLAVRLFGDLKTFLLDEVSETLIYIGRADPGTPTSAAGWQIMRLQKNGTLWSGMWANGVPEFENVFDNRASLDYST